MKSFQLHHTGIKTEFLAWIMQGGKDFNCTIQELKQSVSLVILANDIHFNCTIQELKHRTSLSGISSILEFQLHHTGIKTDIQGSSIWHLYNFNCTIQELKQLSIYFRLFQNLDFNCTIQELKRNNTSLAQFSLSVFQLHHTGIKTKSAK